MSPREPRLGWTLTTLVVLVAAVVLHQMQTAPTVRAGNCGMTVVPDLSRTVCKSVRLRAPASAIDDAFANPTKYAGWGVRCNPNVPASPWNIPRMSLGLENPNVPYHPMFNALEWTCNCN